MPTPPFPPIPEPNTGTTSEPDAYTAQAPDYTKSEGAQDRVFFINLGIFKYGTKDKAHGASVLFGLIIVLLIIGVIIAGFAFHDPANGGWIDKVFSWLGNAFLFIMGVAVGKNDRTGADDKKD